MLTRYLQQLAYTYNDLHDGVLKSVDYSYPNEAERYSTMRVELNCINHLDGNHRDNLLFTFKDVRKLKFAEGNGTNAVIFEAFYKIQENGLFRFEFDGAAGWPDDERNGEAYFYVVSRDFEFRVL